MRKDYHHGGVHGKLNNGILVGLKIHLHGPLEASKTNEVSKFGRRYVIDFQQRYRTIQKCTIG